MSEKRFDYRGRVAIITGASSGIGRAIALDLAGRGTKVVLVARGREALEEVLASCERTAPGSRAFPLDISDRSAVEGMVAETLEGFGAIDVVVNNAGVPLRRHVLKLTPEEVQHAVTVNFMGAVFLTLAALPSMAERGSGHVVNIGSVAGRIGAPRDAGYSATKFALAGWSEALAVDLHGSGVSVHLITVGPVRTPFGRKLQERASYRRPLARPESVAAGVRRCLERGGFERTVPRWFAPVPWLRLAVPDTFIGWVARFDQRAGLPGLARRLLDPRGSGKERSAPRRPTPSRR
jgi:short-subunit dehydrogenase